MPSWFKMEHASFLLQLTIVVAGLSVWLLTSVGKVDQTSAAMITVNSRLDRIFEKLDGLPVLLERVRQLEVQVTDGKGSYSTLDVRLRAIENNNAANHADIQSVKPRKAN